MRPASRGGSVTLVICAFAKCSSMTQSLRHRAARSEQFSFEQISKAGSDTALTRAPGRPDSSFCKIRTPSFPPNCDTPPVRRRSCLERLRRFVLKRTHLLIWISFGRIRVNICTCRAVSDSTVSDHRHRSDLRPAFVTMHCPDGADYVSRYSPARLIVAPASRVERYSTPFLAGSRRTSTVLTNSSVVAC